LWPFHDEVYWGLTQRIYREEFDPSYTGDEADYEYAERPREVHRAVARVALTGRIRKPLMTLHGTYDTLLPIGTDSDVYAELVRARSKAPFRYYRLEAANHVDGLHDAYPDRLRPLLPCMRAAFTALEDWTRDGRTPPEERHAPPAFRGRPREHLLPLVLTAGRTPKTAPKIRVPSASTQVSGCVRGGW